MKFYSLIPVLMLWLCSCNDFLKESSQDEVRPSTVEDLDEVLNGEAYCAEYAYEAFDVTEIFTDDRQCNGLVYPSDQTDLENNRWKFSWDREMFDPNGPGSDITNWYLPYKKIKGCNVILDYLDNVSGDKKKKEALRGEAYTMRGYYYFLLVNYFGLPYTMGDPEVNPGVPLKLTMSVTDEFFTRNSVAEVYRSIEHDLLLGSKLMEENDVASKSLYKASHLMAKALLSRIYLYMGNWDKAIKYADTLLNLKPQLLCLTDYSSSYSENVFSVDTPDEIIWVTPEKSFIMNPPKGPWGLSDNLIGLFDEADKRSSFYIYWALDWEVWENWAPYVVKDWTHGNDGIRTAEMYLNRAEGYIRKYMETGSDEFRQKALADLNELRVNRYDTKLAAYEPVDIVNADDLFAFYKEERRRELCDENNHRWFDIRRYGDEVEHVYFLNPGEEINYLLTKNDLRYALPIPERVRKQNPKLEQNQY